MALLTCKDVTLGYDGVKIVKGLDFTVSSGDYLCIVGENGSGKSTLMKTILRLKTPLSGEISTGDGLKQTEISYLPQQKEVQKDFPASVREIVLSGCLNRCGWRPFYNRNEKIMAEENMEKMGVSHLARKCFRDLSGGQQQRVLLARALCAARKLLLLDEPTAGLDPKGTAEIYDRIQRFNQEDGITIIMITHDMDAAIRYASHILHISHKPLFFGKTEEYVKSKVYCAFQERREA